MLGMCNRESVKTVVDNGERFFFFFFSEPVC